MASKTTVLLIDDLDGKDADETIEFSLDGVVYEIDLSDKNAQKLRNAFAPFAEAGRKIGRRASGVAKKTAKPAAQFDSSDRLALKAFAKKNKLGDVADRGRISQTIVDAWVAAGRPG